MIVDVVVSMVVGLGICGNLGKEVADDEKKSPLILIKLVWENVVLMCATMGFSILNSRICQTCPPTPSNRWHLICIALPTQGYGPIKFQG